MDVYHLHHMYVRKRLMVMCCCIKIADCTGQERSACDCVCFCIPWLQSNSYVWVGEQMYFLEHDTSWSLVA